MSMQGSSPHGPEQEVIGIFPVVEISLSKEHNQGALKMDLNQVSEITKCRTDWH